MIRVVTFIGGPMDGLSRSYPEAPPSVAVAMQPPRRLSDAAILSMSPNEADRITCSRVTYRIIRLPYAIVDEMQEGIERYVGFRVPDPETR